MTYRATHLLAATQPNPVAYRLPSPSETVLLRPGVLLFMEEPARGCVESVTMATYGRDEREVSIDVRYLGRLGVVFSVRHSSLEAFWKYHLPPVATGIDWLTWATKGPAPDTDTFTKPDATQAENRVITGSHPLSIQTVGTAPDVDADTQAKVVEAWYSIQRQECGPQDTDYEEDGRGRPTAILIGDAPHQRRFTIDQCRAFATAALSAKVAASDTARHEADRRQVMGPIDDGDEAGAKDAGGDQ